MRNTLLLRWVVLSGHFFYAGIVYAVNSGGFSRQPKFCQVGVGVNLWLRMLVPLTRFWYFLGFCSNALKNACSPTFPCRTPKCYRTFGRDYCWRKRCARVKEILASVYSGNMHCNSTNHTFVLVAIVADTAILQSIDQESWPQPADIFERGAKWLTCCCTIFGGKTVYLVLCLNMILKTSWEGALPAFPSPGCGPVRNNQ